MNRTLFLILGMYLAIVLALIFSGCVNPLPRNRGSEEIRAVIQVCETNRGHAWAVVLASGTIDVTCRFQTSEQR